MTIQELQDWVQSDWETKSSHSPTREQQILYLIEEIGEVAEAIRKLDGHKQRSENSVNLDSELADALISLVTLANTYDVNLTKELENFKNRLAERHNQGL